MVTFTDLGQFDGDKLERAYWEHFWSMQEIADFLDISVRSVNTLFEENGIETRSPTEGKKIRQMRDDGFTPSDIEAVMYERTEEAERDRDVEPDEDVKWELLT